MDLALNFFTKTRWDTFQPPKSCHIE